METLTAALLIALGITGGILTTIAGLGGGLFLVAALGLVRGAREALAVSTPALLVSNFHRALLFRHQINRKVARAIAIGAIPGGLVGGLVLPALPEAAVASLLVAATVVALLRRFKVIELAPSPRALTLSGGGIGAIAATSGGAGVLVGPVLISAGLSGTAYVATVAACGVAIHIGRLGGYSLSGLLTLSSVPDIACVLVGLLTGNLVGRKLRRFATTSIQSHVELVALAITVLAAVWGALR